MEYYSAITKEEILPFATAWINLEGIMLSEIPTEPPRCSVSLLELKKTKQKCHLCGHMYISDTSA